MFSKGGWRQEVAWRKIPLCMVKKQTRPYLTGPYARHVIAGIGHFIQRERPDAVVEANLQLARGKNKLR